jgi:lysophospholipase L1-like esterase
MIVADGDSITANTGESTNFVLSGRYPDQALSTMSPRNVEYMAAIGGYTCDQDIAKFAATVAPLFALRTNKKVYSIGCGTNDFTLGLTPAYVYNDIQTLCSMVKAIDSTIGVIVLTKLPSSFPGNTTANVSGLNTLIYAGGACPMTIADVASDPTIGQPGQNTNLTYYLDGTHPTVAGHAIMATYYKPALQALGIQ